MLEKDAVVGEQFNKRHMAAMASDAKVNKFIRFFRSEYYTTNCSHQGST